MHGISPPGVVVLLSVSVTESRPFSILDPSPFNGGSVVTRCNPKFNDEAKKTASKK